MADDEDFVKLDTEERLAADAAFKKLAGPDRVAVPPGVRSAADVGDEAGRVFSAINEKHIAPALGAPVDIANAGLRKLGLGSDAPLFGSKMLTAAMRGSGMSREGASAQTTLGQAGEHVLGGAADAAISGGGVGGAIRGVGRSLGSKGMEVAGSKLASPGSNLAAGAGGGAGGAIGQKAFEGTSMEKPAEAFGELFGATATGLAPSKVLNMRMRPSAPPDPTLAAYERLKLAPTWAEYPESNRFSQWLEGNVLPQTLGGGGVMEKAKQRRLAEMTGIQQRISESYGTPKERFDMGKQMQEDVLGTWVQTKENEGRIIEDITNKYANQGFYASNLINAVTKPVGAATSSAVRSTTVDPLVQEMAGIIRNTGGSLSFADTKALRTKLGYALEPGFQKNVNDAQVKQMYDALSKDMEIAVKSVSPDDFTTLQAANKRYGMAQDAFRQNFKKIVGTEKMPVAPERAYDIMTAAGTEKARGDLNEFKSVWDAMSPTARGNLSSTVLSRMGAMDKSAVGSVETWSLGNFLSEYRNLSGEARNMLFKSTGNGKIAQELDDLVTVTDNVDRKVAKLMSTSKSNAGGIMLNQVSTGQLLGGAALGAGDGGSLMASGMGLLKTIGGPYVVAQILTNPTAVRTIKKTMVKLEDAVDAATRAAIDVEAIPKVRAQANQENQNGARKAPDGLYYLPDPARPGKYLRVNQ